MKRKQCTCRRVNVLTSGVGCIVEFLALYKVVTSLYRANNMYTFFLTGELLEICI